jgi:cytochrome c oxidase subunit II
VGKASVLQSVLSPSGPQAAHIERLWWLMFWVSTAVFVIVTVMVVGAIVSRRRPPARDEALNAGVTIAVGATVLTLFVLLVASIWTGRAVASLGAESAVTINLIGHQWWWEAEYEEAVPSYRFRTANELHIPVGRPVVLKVTSRDVIHSFWVPNLHGKRDLVPGYTTAIWIQADTPGVYRGQCAEFCGIQHARMALYVTAESNDDFERWKMNQRREAAAPSNEVQRRGRDVFLHSTCTQCHTIRGTIAGATMGPDLTHLASRGTLAAGTLPNNRGHLAGWIADAQTVKPGNHMPPNSLQAGDMNALLTYLESLK